MAEIMGAGALDTPTGNAMPSAGSWEGPEQAWSSEETLAGQVLGIILEVLDSPGLPRESKDRLLRRLDEHPGHPERALAEHLRELRTAERN